MTVDDVLAIERLERASLSPDGSLVAAVVLRGALPGEIFGRASYEIDPSRADIWIIDRATGAKRNLTNGRSRAAGALCATWSPDGQRLAFLSTRPTDAEPQGGNNVRLYVWDRHSDELIRLSEQAVVTQTRYGGGLNKLDIAGPNAVSADACSAGDENPPFAWLDAQRLLVAFLPTGRTSALLDASERIYQHTQATREAMQTGREAMVSVSGSGLERTGAGPEEIAILAVGNVPNRQWTNVASVPLYPFNGSLGVRVSPDGRRAAVLATTGSIPPRSGIPWARNDGDWTVEKRLGVIDLVEPQPMKWVSPVSTNGTDLRL